MQVYVTKYALTAGIYVEEVEVPLSDHGHYVYTTGQCRQQFRMGRDAFLTYEEAARAARVMRDKKALSLRKQLRKMRGLLFPTKTPAVEKEPGE